MKKIIFLLLISFYCYGSNFTVYTYDHDFSNIKDSKMRSVINCAFENNDELKYIKIPAGRQLHFLEKGKIGVIYPLFEDSNLYDKFYFLGPLSYDEVLIISRNLFDYTSLGYVRNDMFFNLANKKYSLLKKFKDSYQVSSTESLIKGFIQGRTNSIVLRRADLTERLKDSKIKINSLGFYSSQFAIHKSLVNFTSVISKFKNCLGKVEIKLDESDRAIMLDILLRKQKKIILKKFYDQKIFNVNPIEVDKNWNNTNFKLKNEILNSDNSKELREMKNDFPFIKEAFLFNHFGHISGMSDITTDFDQSDEYKFQIVKKYERVTIKNISNINYDHSANIFNVNLTLPLYENGKFKGGLHLVLDVNDFIHYACETEKKLCTFSR